MSTELLDRPPQSSASLTLVERIDPPDSAPDAIADELVDRAEISNGKHLVKLSKTEADIAALKAEAERTTFSCATTRDDKATRQFRARCVSMRTAIKDHCLALRAPAKKFADDVIAEERRLTALVAEVEAIPDKVIREDEKARADRKLAEQERAAAISVAIQQIAELPLKHIASDCETLEGVIADLQTRPIEEDEFDDFIAAATQAVEKALAALTNLLEGAQAREAEAQHAAAQRNQTEEQRQRNESRAAELRELESKQQARDEAARSLVAEAERKAQEARDALAAAEHAVTQAQERAKAVVEEERRQREVKYAKAAGALYEALGTVFADPEFTKLADVTQARVTTALHNANS